MRRRPTLMLALLWIAVNLVGCGPVKFVKTWKNPQAQPVSWTGKKVAAFTMTLRTGTRQEAERALAAELTRRGAVGVAGYTLLPPDADRDRQALRQMLQKTDLAGAVLMEIAGIDQELSFTGPNYSTFSDYWSNSWSSTYAPPSLTSDTTLVVRTLVYSVDQDALLWAGTSKTTNPKTVGTTVLQLVDAAGRELKKSGLLKR